MNVTIALLIVSVILLILLYAKERKENRKLSQINSQLKEEKALLEQKAKFSEELKQLLEGQISDYFTKTNNAILEQAQRQIQGELSKHQANVEKIFKPFEQVIDRYNDIVQQYFQATSGKFGTLDAQLRNLEKATQQLQNNTQQLVKIFSNAQVRGQWGEMQLEKIFQLAGLQPGVHYDAQKGQKDQKRPDFVIYMPKGKNIVIDVKTPMNNFFRFTQATDENQQKTFAQAHVKDIENMIKNLASKQYQENLKDSFEYVILYIPVEAAYSLALYTDINIYKKAYDKGIILASPTTILPLLQIIQLMWLQVEAEDNIKKIIKEASELYNRYATLTGHIDNLGKKLQDAVQAYNSFLGSWNERMDPQIRRLQELGIKTQKQIQPARNIDIQPKTQ